MPDGDHIDLTIDVLHECPYQARSYTKVLFGSRAVAGKMTEYPLRWLQFSCQISLQKQML